MSERFKELVLKTSDSERGRGFESHPLRQEHYGEVPKRLKGLPWKGSRSLIAARGFKSLLLRHFYAKKILKNKYKKVLTLDLKLGIIIFVVAKTDKKSTLKTEQCNNP